MRTKEKAKKVAKPKKGSKGKKKTKKNSSMNFFSKIMLALLFISIITLAVFLIVKNFNTDNDDKARTEFSIESKKELKSEKQSSTETKEVKEEKSEEKIKQDIDNKEVKKEHQKEEVKSEPKKEVVKNEVKKKQSKEQNLESESKTLSGIWLSTIQGASLTIDEFGYRIDFFGVDASNPIIGKYSIDDNQITFINDDSECKGIKGIYKISFNKKNFSLIAKDDDCTKRRNILETEWEWIEI